MKALKNIENGVRAVLSKHFPVFFTRVLYNHFVGHSLNLDKPEAFTEKIQWLKLYRYTGNETVQNCIDKYEVRKYVSSHGCGELLNDLIGVWECVDDIDWESLPEKFVLKCNHGSAMNIIVKDKSKLNIKKTKEKI